jgi:hypothetical protein
MSRSNRELLAEVFPDVPVRGEIGEHDTLLSSTRGGASDLGADRPSRRRRNRNRVPKLSSTYRNPMVKHEPELHTGRLRAVCEILVKLQAERSSRGLT